MRRIKDYHRKKYNNPFFQRRSGRGYNFRLAKRSISWRGKFIFIFLLAVLGGGIYFIFYSPYFSINKIEVLGTERIKSEDVRSTVEEHLSKQRFLFFLQRNIFIFDENSAGENINDKYVLKSWKIDKRLPGTLLVSIEERTPALIWKTLEKHFLVDWDGTIIREISAEEMSLYLLNQPGGKMALVFDDNNTPIMPKEEILSRETVQVITNLQNDIPKTSGLIINNFKMANRSDPVIRGLTSEGWEIYFSTAGDLNAQIEKLESFLKEKNQEGRKTLQYVDLRFADRIYYK